MKVAIERINELLSENRCKAIVAAASLALVITMLTIGSCALQGIEEPQGQADREAQSSADEVHETYNAETTEDAVGEESEDAEESASGEAQEESALAQEENSNKGQSSSTRSEASSSDRRSQSQSSSGGSPQSGSSSSGSKTADNRKWVEETSEVWVVDKEAWSEEVPVYETVERSICNVCGADITGNTSAHNKAHMLAGEGSGYHSETQRVQTGTKTVEHAEQGHWKTVATGGHWE